MIFPGTENPEGPKSDSTKKIPDVPVSADLSPAQTFLQYLGVLLCFSYSTPRLMQNLSPLPPSARRWPSPVKIWWAVALSLLEIFLSSYYRLSLLFFSSP